MLSSNLTNNGSDIIAGHIESEASVEVATVVSASEMSESQQEALVKKLKSMANVKEVKLDIQTDKSLIGGFTVQIGSRIIDTSIQGQLKKLASHLGASSPE